MAAILSGYVRDAETGETLPGATVVWKDNGIGTTTDMNGFYTIEDLPAGRHTFQVSFIGFQQQEFTIEMSGKVAYTKDVLLAISSLALNEVVVNERAAGQVRTLREQKEVEKIVTLVS